MAEEDEDGHTTGPGPSDSNLDVEQKTEIDTLLNFLVISSILHLGGPHWWNM